MQNFLREKIMHAMNTIKYFTLYYKLGMLQAFRLWVLCIVRRVRGDPRRSPGPLVVVVDAVLVRYPWGRWGGPHAGLDSLPCPSSWWAHGRWTHFGRIRGTPCSTIAPGRLSKVSIKSVIKESPFCDLMTTSST